MDSEPGGHSPVKASRRNGAPRHVAIIMDGNGRWAHQRGLPRIEGHRRGAEALRRIVRHAGQLGLEYLTLFAFSSENWSRPAGEVSDLLGLLERFVRSDLEVLRAAGVRVHVIGAREGLPPRIATLLDDAERITGGNDKLRLVIAFNYGGRDEIVRAARALASEVQAGRMDPRDIDGQAFASRLDTAPFPDPDLIIRTSGEMRLSNFLLWQAAYSELVFVPTFWPDFGEADFEAAIATYGARERRFGGIPATAGA